MNVRVKVCGVTTLEDALMCIDAGADEIGLNFWPKSVRRCDWEIARTLVARASGRIRTVAVFVDATLDEMSRALDEIGVDALQLHGSESPEVVEGFAGRAYKALRAEGPQTLEQAARYSGRLILLDAFVPGLVGGTGQTFDWTLARELAKTRDVLLAGGLHPENVERAIAQARPFGVDVASGVERAPGQKDERLVRAFIESVRRANQLHSPQ